MLDAPHDFPVDFDGSRRPLVPLAVAVVDALILDAASMPFLVVVPQAPFNALLLILVGAEVRLEQVAGSKVRHNGIITRRLISPRHPAVYTFTMFRHDAPL